MHAPCDQTVVPQKGRLAKILRATRKLSNHAATSGGMSDPDDRSNSLRQGSAGAVLEPVLPETGTCSNSSSARTEMGAAEPVDSCRFVDSAAPESHNTYYPEELKQSWSRLHVATWRSSHYAEGVGSVTRLCTASSKHPQNP